MRRAGMLMVLSVGLLVGCAERGAPEGDADPATPPEPARAVAVERAGATGDGARACAAARYRALVGQPITVIDTTALPRPLRVVPAGRRTTADHRPERMNIVVGRDGRIAGVRCG